MGHERHADVKDRLYYSSDRPPSGLRPPPLCFLLTFVPTGFPTGLLRRDVTLNVNELSAFQEKKPVVDFFSFPPRPRVQPDAGRFVWQPG